jgi:hypothetical protein
MENVGNITPPCVDLLVPMINPLIWYKSWMRQETNGVGITGQLRASTHWPLKHIYFSEQKRLYYQAHESHTQKYACHKVWACYSLICRNNYFPVKLIIVQPNSPYSIVLAPISISYRKGEHRTKLFHLTCTLTRSKYIRVILYGLILVFESI